MIPALPVAAFLPEIAAAVRSAGKAVVQAEPGAGKTMLVPELFARELTDRRVILVEPRRIAARAAAAGLAAVHRGELGREYGYLVRGDQAMGRETRVLAVTPGILLNLLREDMSLPGVGALIFDEFHERSLESDLAFTLALDVRSGLREDLLLAVMSATLDADRIGGFLAAPVVTVPGRSFPVTLTRSSGSPDVRDAPAECARAALDMLASGPGDGLIFLPGAEEIDRCAARLAPALPPDVKLHRLHGALPFAEQRRALLPAAPGERKLILATNVAESSLTVEGVRWVVDSGWEKVPVYRPGAGLTFIEPRRITLDSARQRSGRAGRTAPGRAHRCYDAHQERAMPPHPTPEIRDAELASLTLTLAHWGAEAGQLRWLDPPPEAALNAARTTLRRLGLLTAAGRLTAAGERAVGLPVHPRLAAMLLAAPPPERHTAAVLAALLEEKSPPGTDLRDQLVRWERRPAEFSLQRKLAARLDRVFPGPERLLPEAAGGLIATAFPEWVGGARTRHGREFQLACGRAALLREDDPLTGAEFLAVARLDAGSRRDPTIRLAAPLAREELETRFAGELTWEVVTSFDPDTARFTARREHRLHALALTSTPCPPPEAGRTAALVREALRRRIQLPPPEAGEACRLVDRVRFGRDRGLPELPDWSPDALAELLPDAVENHTGVRNFAELKKAPWTDLLAALLPYPLRRELDRLFPAEFTAPTGMKFRIDYSGDPPTLAIPIQQLYGVTCHPTAGADRIPLKLELLSPANRPVQVTSDLPGFWRGNWTLVVREMRSRYPKHEWPDDPAAAAPMRRSLKRATPRP